MDELNNMVEERLAGLQRGLTDQIDGVTGWIFSYLICYLYVRCQERESIHTNVINLKIKAFGIFNVKFGIKKILPT